MPIEVEQKLKALGIPFILHEHPAVFTIEEAEIHCHQIPGMACKNLLLRDPKKKSFFLVVFPAHKRVPISEISPLRLSFANDQLLKEKLAVEPGSVSPFGIMNNESKDVQLIIDEEVYQADRVCFHPNRNTATLELTGNAFREWLNLSERPYSLFKK